MVLDLDAGLMNVIQTTVTDFVVRPLETSRNDTRKLYAANEDYAVQPSIDPITLEPNFRAPIGFTQHNVNLTFKLKALPAGKLKAGDKVLVDYDFQVGCHDSLFMSFFAPNRSNVRNHAKAISPLPSLLFSFPLIFSFSCVL
jgi:hypothetical protein